MDVAEEAIDRAEKINDRASPRASGGAGAGEPKPCSTRTTSQSVSTVTTPWGKTTTIKGADGTQVVVKDGSVYIDGELVKRKD